MITPIQDLHFRFFKMPFLKGQSVIFLIFLAGFIVQVNSQKAEKETKRNGKGKNELCMPLVLE